MIVLRRPSSRLHSARPWCAALALLASGLGGAARAEPPAAAAPPAAVPARYPVALSVIASDRAREATYEHPESGLFGAPLNAGSTTRVGALALRSLRAIALRLFTAGAGAQVTLQLERVTPSLEPEAGGWLAAVKEVLVLRDGSGAELGRWTSSARDRIEGLGESAIPAAFERAVALAAQDFEAAFEEPEGVRAFMQAQGVQPGQVARRQAGVERPPPSQPLTPGEPRTRPRFYADAGASLLPVNFADSTQPALAETMPVGVFELRVGLAGSWYFAQLAFSRWSSSRSVLPTRAPSFDLSQWSLGTDAGLQLQYGGLFDVAAGLGLRWTSGRIDHGPTSGYDGTQDGDPPFWIEQGKLVPSALIALRMTPEVRLLRGHARISVEARHLFTSSDYTTFDSPQGGRQWLEVSADNTVTLLFGGEWSLW